MELSVHANEVTPFVPPSRGYELPPVRGWHVDVASRDQIDLLASLLDEWPGDAPVVMHARGQAKRLARTAAADHRLKSELERIFGASAVREGAPQ
jgi:hypothetical protein